jgi:hypothetical protein
MNELMKPQPLDYESPSIRPKRRLWASSRLGILSFLILAVDVVVAGFVIHTPESLLAGALVAGIGSIVGAVGVYSDEGKLLAVLATVLNSVLFFGALFIYPFTFDNQ